MTVLRIPFRLDARKRLHSSRLALTVLSTLVALTFACGDDSDADTGTRDASGDSSRDTGGTDTGGTDTGTDTGGTDTGGTDTGGADTGSDSAVGDCVPECGTGRTCCDGVCVNTANDLRHCGGCNSDCPAPEMYCTGGRCEAVPCETICGGASNCCGGACCGLGQLCCDTQGPIERGPSCIDADPETGTCPQGCAPLCMCNAPETPIATPDGHSPIAELRVGDLVYSLEGEAVVIVPIAAIRTATVPSDHRVVRLAFDDGTTVEISPSHPLADGRTIGELRAGDSIEGVVVMSATRVAYERDQTHDILPASDSGTYFVGDALIASTIAH